MIAIPIVCPTIEELNPKTPKEYLELYITKGNPKTFHLNGDLQCSEGRRRSIQDLYGLLVTKFGEYSLLQLQEDLLDLSAEFLNRDNRNPMIFRCKDIGRIVVTSLHYREIFFLGNVSEELPYALELDDKDYITLVQNFINIYEENKDGTYLQRRIAKNQKFSFESVICN